MKKWHLAVGVLALAVFATSVFAVGPGPRAGGGCQDCPGPGYGAGPGAGPGAGKGFGRWASELNLTKEQQDRLVDLRKRQYEETKPLRDEMYQKRQEMRDLYTNPAADDATILARQKEVSALQQKMQEKMLQFKLEQRKVFTPEQLEKMKGLSYGPGRGGRQGYGPGRGPGSGADCCG